MAMGKKAKKSEFDEIIKNIESGLTGDPQKDMKYLDQQSGNYSKHEQNDLIMGEIKRMRSEIRLQKEKETEYEKIITGIESGLTGDAKSDMKYLDQQCGIYCKHESSDDILRAIGGMRNKIRSQWKTDKTNRPASELTFPEMSEEIKLGLTNDSEKEEDPHNKQAGKQPADDRSFDEILKEIESGLTGDSKKDEKYLDEQSEKYSKHEKSKQIIGAIGGIRYKIRSGANKDKAAPPKHESELEEIKKEIKSGLSGERDKDMLYLDEQAKKYAKHTLKADILSAIGTMRYDFKHSEFDGRKPSVQGTEYDAIMKEILSGLKGDYEKDRDYLDKKAKKYAKHVLGSEIIREIGRMTYDMLPPEKKKELDDFIKENNYGVEKATKESVRLYDEKDLEGALKVIEEVRKRIEWEDGTVRFYQDDSVSEYHSFRNVLEHMIYEFTRKPKRTLRRIPEDFGSFYHQYGATLFELKRFEEARTALKKAIKANPLLLDSVFELAEISKVHGDWEEFLKLTKSCHEFAYKGEYLSRYYRNLGFYYIEQKKYDLARELYIIALYYENDNSMAKSELQFIAEVTGKTNVNMPVDKTEKMFEKNDIRFGPNMKVLQTCLEVGEAAMEQKEYDSAWLGYYSAFSLAPTDEVKRLLDKIPRKNVYVTRPEDGMAALMENLKKGMVECSVKIVSPEEKKRLERER